MYFGYCDEIIQYFNDFPLYYNYKECHKDRCDAPLRIYSHTELLKENGKLLVHTVHWEIQNTNEHELGHSSCNIQYLNCCFRHTKLNMVISPKKNAYLVCNQNENENDLKYFGLFYYFQNFHGVFLLCTKLHLNSFESNKKSKNYRFG